MPNKVDAWLDDNGKLHASEEEANTANQQIALDTLRANALRVLMELVPAHTDIYMERLTYYNRAAIQPLADYLDCLMKASDERAEKYG